MKKSNFEPNILDGTLSREEYKNAWDKFLAKRRSLVIHVPAQKADENCQCEVSDAGNKNIQV